MPRWLIQIMIVGLCPTLTVQQRVTDEEAIAEGSRRTSSVTEEQIGAFTKQMLKAGLHPSSQDREVFIPVHGRTLLLEKIPDKGMRFGLILAAFNTTADDLVGLQKNDNLFSLSLLGIEDGNVCHHAVKSQSNLRFLSLHECGVTDDHLLQLTDLKHLESLDLRKTKIRGPGLAALKSLPALESLEVNMTNEQFRTLVDCGLVHLLPIAHGPNKTTARTDADLVELELNGFYGFEVNDGMLESLERLTTLRQLSLIETHVTNAGIPQVLRLPQLETLNLERSRINDAAIQLLATAPHLYSLVLDETKITAAGLVHLGKLSKLKTLHLNRCKVDDESLAVLGVLPALEKLEIGATQIRFEEQFAPGAFAKLLHLNVNGSNVTDRGMPVIAQLPELEWLDLTLCKVGNDGVKSLTACRKLEVLYLNRTDITDEALRHLASIPTLQTVSLHSTNVTDAGLQHFAGMKNLRSLILFGTKVSANGVQQLQTALPQCEIAR